MKKAASFEAAFSEFANRKNRIREFNNYLFFCAAPPVAAVALLGCIFWA